MVDMTTTTSPYVVMLHDATVMALLFVKTAALMWKPDPPDDEDVIAHQETVSELLAVTRSAE